MAPNLFCPITAFSELFVSNKNFFYHLESIRVNNAYLPREFTSREKYNDCRGYRTMVSAFDGWQLHHSCRAKCF